MDRRRTDSANQAAERMTETIQQSYRSIADHAVALQEHNIRFFQSVFESWNEMLGGQAEANRATTQSFLEQAQRQQEAFRTLAQESVGAYMDFLDSIFSYAQGRSRDRRASR